MTKRECLQCGKKLVGRSDKKFCDTPCRNAYYAATREQEEVAYVKKINSILLKNRKILVSLMEGKGKKAYFDRTLLASNGFNFQYCTGTYVNRQEKMYFYVYDFGWMEFSLQEIMVVRK